MIEERYKPAFKVLAIAVILIMAGMFMQPNDDGTEPEISDRVLSAILAGAFAVCLFGIIYMITVEPYKKPYAVIKPLEIKNGDRVRYKTTYTEKEFVGEIVSKGAGSSVCIKWETGLVSHHWSGFLATRYKDGYIKMTYHSLDGEYPR